MRIVKFYKNGCVPCNTVANYLTSSGIAADKVENINIFDDPDAAVDAGIMSVPVTLLVGDDGTELIRVNGFNKDKLQELVAAFKQG